MYMGTNRQVAKNTLFLYFRMILIMLVSLFTVRVVINVLGIIDYGIFNAVGGIVLILSFFTNTLTSAAQRFFSIELAGGDMKRLNIAFNSILIIYLCASILIVLLSEVFGLWFLYHKMIIPEDRLFAAQWVFQCSLLSFIFMILSTPYKAIIVAYENMKIFAWVGILEAFFRLGIVYLLLIGSGDRLVLYSILTCVVSVVVCSIDISICLYKYPAARFRFRFEKGLLKHVMGYSSWTMFGTLAGVANNQGITLLLNMFFGPTANAAQAVSRQVGNAVLSFSNNIFIAMRPPLTKYYAEGAREKMLDLFYKGSKYSYFLLLIMLIPLMFQTEYVLKLWLGEVGEYMVVFTRLTLIYIALLIISNPITIIMQAADKVKMYHGIVDGFTLTSIVISYVLFRFGAPPVSIFWVINLFFLIAHGIRVLLLDKVLNHIAKEYFKLFVLPTTIVTLCVCFSIEILRSISCHVNLKFLIISFSGCLLTCVFGYFFGLKTVERQQIKEFLYRKYSGNFLLKFLSKNNR